MSEQAIVNRALLLAALQGRQVAVKDRTTPDYYESDPEEGESRGRGWYYQTQQGSWIYLGSNLEDARQTAMTASISQGVVGKPPKALEATWGDIALRWGTALALPLAIGTATGALRREGHELEAMAVDAVAAIGGALLLQKGPSESARNAGAAMLGASAADVGQQYLSGPAADLYRAMFPDKSAKADLAKLDEAERAAQAKAQDAAKQAEKQEQQQVPEPAKATG
jgi:hypothetical protein